MDPASLRILLKKHGRLLSNSALALLIFAAGWQLGRAMSPYYAAHPIIFEDRNCANCSSSGGTSEELVSLQQQGKQEDQEQTPATTSPPAVEVTGATTTEQAAKAFVASVKSTLYHHPDCPAVKRIKPENLVRFASQQEAEAAGYSPSKCTQGKLGL